MLLKTMHAKCRTTFKFVEFMTVFFTFMISILGFSGQISYQFSDEKSTGNLFYWHRTHSSELLTSTGSKYKLFKTQSFN